MSTMSAPSGLLPLSLISEHKSTQGGSAAVQPLPFPSEKLPIVQPAKPTPNGMECSPPLVPVIPTQADTQPSLPCGASVESGGVEEKIGIEGGAPFPQSDLLEAAPFVAGPIVEQLPATEPASAPLPAADLPSSNALPAQAVSQPPVAQDLTPAPVSDSQAPPSSIPQSQPVSNLQLPAPNLSLPSPASPKQSKEKSEILQDTPKDCESLSTIASESPSATDKQEPIVEKVAIEPQTEGNKAEKSDDRPIVEPSPPAVPAPDQVPQPTATEPSQQSAPPTLLTQHGRPPKRAAKNTNIGTSKKNATVNSAPAPSTVSEGSDDQRTKRKRLPTQVYQSPIPELNIIAKMSKTEKPADKNPEEKLIVFYKNEFLAVRNEEGGFYICRALQNVFKTSTRIKIRWLSQQENTDVYSPDFYDFTEFDCILTNLAMDKLQKEKFKLPDFEARRTLNILKRAINKQKGVTAPEETNITEEHPDGIDLSLYRNEEQLKKRKRSVRSKVPKKKGRNAKQIDTAKKNRDIDKRKPGNTMKKSNPASSSSTRRAGRSVGKTEKTVVQRILESKKMGRRKASSSPEANQSTSVVPAAKEVAKKKETSRAPPPKRKMNDPPSAPAPEKKAKTGPGSSKTRSGVAGGPNVAQQQQARRSTRTK